MVWFWLQAAEAREWTLDLIRVTVNALQLLSHMGQPEHFVPEAAATFARDCVALFVAWQPVLSAFDKRELSIGEDIVCIAADAYMQAHRGGDLKYVAQVRLLLISRLLVA